ncbi:MAG TPA: hypothetical protein PKH65_01045 [Bacteroidia bacterium]|nr:hypothetical protein [Bacteroidia bacterium]HNT79239.1 hypothetical protein [Bacteroidia bacterium]
MSNVLFKCAESDFPVLKISLDYKVLNSNAAALPILQHWNCANGTIIPEEIMRLYPELKYCLDRRVEGYVHVSYNEYTIKFSVIPFPEAGYVGLYGYLIEKTDQFNRVLRMLN